MAEPLVIRLVLNSQKRRPQKTTSVRYTSSYFNAELGQAVATGGGSTESAPVVIDGYDSVSSGKVL